MKSRINISMAGNMAANINQTGRVCDEPSGLISQLLFSGAVGETPSGTSSLCEQITYHSFYSFQI